MSLVSHNKIRSRQLVLCLRTIYESRLIKRWHSLRSKIDGTFFYVNSIQRLYSLATYQHVNRPTVAMANRQLHHRLISLLPALARLYDFGCIKKFAADNQYLIQQSCS